MSSGVPLIADGETTVATQPFTEETGRKEEETHERHVTIAFKGPAAHAQHCTQNLLQMRFSCFITGFGHKIRVQYFVDFLL